MSEDSETNDSDSGRQLVDILGEDFVRRLRAGDLPSIEEYTARHPEIANQIRAVFPALAIMERANPDADETLRPDHRSIIKPASRIGDYRITRKVGQGGMGVVYEAHQESLNRRVALKILPRHIAGDEKFIERFKREARAAAKLHHTNIVPVFDVGQDGDTLYYAMQFIDGQGLDAVQREIARLSQDGMLAVSNSSVSGLLYGDPAKGSTFASKSRSYFRSIAKLGASAADALAFAHERSIIHRDVKPSNLILDTDGVLWLADFGLAKTSDSELTETGDFLGTARYMSPERFKGQGDHRGDIYGLGITLYELVTLRPAFEANDHLQLMDQIANYEPRKPRDVNKQIPLDLETIILKSMEKDPRRRYQKASDLAGDLRRFIDDQPIHARRAVLVERTIRWMRKHKAQTAAMFSMLIAITALIVGTIIILQERDIAQANEQKALEQSSRADQAAERANRSAAITIDVMAELVESVQIELRNHPELLSLKRKMLSNAESKLGQVAELSGDSQELTGLKIRTFQTMGRLSYEIGEYEKCRRYYETALKLADLLEEQDAATQTVYKAKSTIYVGLGSMAFEKHDHEEARSYYKLAFDNDKAWTDFAPEDVDAQMRFSYAADNLADSYVLLNERNWDKAEQYHQLAFNIRKQLKESINSDYELDYYYAISHMKLGDMYYGRSTVPDVSEAERRTCLGKAQDWFLHSLTLSLELVRRYRDDEVRSLRQLAAIYERVADTCEGNEANDYYTKSIEIKDRLAPKLPLDRNFQRDRAISWGRAALNQFNANEKEKAIEYMNKCLSILRETSQRIPEDTGLKIDEMIALYQIGTMSDDAKALEYWNAALAIGDALILAGKISQDFDYYLEIKKASLELEKGE